MNPPPFRPTAARHAEIRTHARAMFVAAHRDQRQRRTRVASLPAVALTGGIVAYVAWFLAVARGLL